MFIVFSLLSIHNHDLRLPYTLRSAMFLKFRFFCESNDPNEISKVKKSSMKKIKNSQKNSGLTFWPKLKITRLIDIF